MIPITFIGASTHWTPGLAVDLMNVFADQPLEFRLHDIDPRAMDLCAEWGAMANRKLGRHDVWRICPDRADALRDTRAVIITITTGGLDADEASIAIAEKYRVFPTVGDSTGPTGWCRILRNVPVFQAFAADFARHCPRAFIANYTNPMAALTSTIELCCDNPVVGLCHAYHETKRFLKEIFGLDTWDPISMRLAGVNHFHWIVDFTVDGRDGYALLREKIGAGSLRDLIPGCGEDIVDDRGKVSVYGGKELCAELYETYGRLPYIGDRHTCEFLTYAINGDVERSAVDNRQGLTYDRIRWCHLTRTSIEYRRVNMGDREAGVRAMVAGTQDLPKRSSETVAEMIRANIVNKPFTDAINALNRGQIPGLPLGAGVETMGTIDGLGVHPFTVPDVPEPILELVRPAALAQKWATEGAIARDREKLLHALYRDPLCAHLKPPEVRAMAAEMFTASQPWFRL